MEVGDQSDTTIGPLAKKPKTRPTPYSRPILLTGENRSSRKRKSISWKPDEKIRIIHYFELIADERVNVNRFPNSDPQSDPSLSTASVTTTAGSSLDAHNKLPGGKISNAAVDPPMRRSHAKPESEKSVEYLPWRPLISIDFTPALPSPGWNSIERVAQAERETYVLGAIDLPGQPSTLDEPGAPGQTASSKPDGVSGTNSTTSHNESSTKEEASNVTIIPLDNPDGIYTEYPDMYNTGQNFQDWQGAQVRQEYFQQQNYPAPFFFPNFATF